MKWDGVVFLILLHVVAWFWEQITDFIYDNIYEFKKWWHDNNF